MLVDPLCNQSKAEQFQITLEKKELPKKANTDSIAETLLSDIFGKKRKKREDVTTTTEAPKGKKDDKVEDYYAYEEDSDYKVESIGNSTKPGESSKSLKHTKVSKLGKKKPKAPVDTSCDEYGSSLLEWMRKNPDRLGEFLSEKEMPVYPDYGKVG